MSRTRRTTRPGAGKRLAAPAAALLAAALLASCSSDAPKDDLADDPAASEQAQDGDKQSEFFDQADYDRQLELTKATPEGPEGKPWEQMLDPASGGMVDTSEYAMKGGVEGAKLCFSNAGVFNPWRQVGLKTMKAEVAQHDEIADFTVLDAQGKAQIMEMGCYGIGVSRIVAAAIEQNHDERGIIMPAAMAPFQVAIVPIGMGKSAAVRDAAEQLYAALQVAGVEVLLNDRDERPGVMFADMELIGVPHRIVIGERSLKEGNVEYQGRCDAQAQSIPLQNAPEFVKSKL